MSALGSWGLSLLFAALAPAAPTYDVVVLPGSAALVGCSDMALDLNDDGEVLYGCGAQVLLWSRKEGARRLEERVGFPLHAFSGGMQPAYASRFRFGPDGIVLGSTQTEPRVVRTFLADRSGGLRWIEPLEGMTSAIGTAIDGEGRVLGFSFTMGQRLQPFQWTAETGTRWIEGISPQSATLALVANPERWVGLDPGLPADDGYPWFNVIEQVGDQPLRRLSQQPNEGYSLGVVRALSAANVLAGACRLPGTGHPEQGRPCLERDGELHLLDTLPGIAEDVSDSGVVVGWSRAEDQAEQGWIDFGAGPAPFSELMNHQHHPHLMPARILRVNERGWVVAKGWDRDELLFVGIPRE
jgi:hypothetical protein